MEHQAPRHFLLVAGRGSLPGLIYHKLISDGEIVEVTLLPGSDNLDLVPNHTNITPENFIQLLQTYRGMGVDQVVMAGGVERPNQSNIPYQKDKNKDHISLAGGDDSILKQFLTVIEELGFKIWGVQEIVPDLVDHDGILTDQVPSSSNKVDILLAEGIVTSLGAADIGQAVVVRNNRCIAVETMGTDWMLDSIREVFATFSKSPEEKGGILIKASKPNQDLRVDLPTIGPQTVQRVISLGMSGLVIELGKVIIIDKPKVIEMANQGGIFIWSKSINRNYPRKYS